MNIKKNVNEAINKQMNREFYSGYLYLSMAAYFEAENLRGFAHWMRKQAEEEKKHAMKMFEFVSERGGRVALEAIEKPTTSWKSPLAAFEDAYEHEKKVTQMIYDLGDVAAAEKDKATESFLKWFIDEQVEEEDSANEIVQKLKMVGTSGSGLVMLDKDLGKRE
ncbi:MAG: ferritin [Candidatus Micrarchaeota archaeon]